MLLCLVQIVCVLNAEECTIQLVDLKIVRFTSPRARGPCWFSGREQIKSDQKEREKSSRRPLMKFQTGGVTVRFRTGKIFVTIGFGMQFIKPVREAFYGWFHVLSTARSLQLRPFRYIILRCFSYVERAFALLNFVRLQGFYLVVDLVFLRSCARKRTDCSKIDDAVGNFVLVTHGRGRCEQSKRNERK